MSLYLGENLIAGQSTDIGASAVRNLGEIVSSTIPLVDAGLHLLDGAVLAGSGIYSEFVNYIKDLYNSGEYSDLFVLEGDWQSSVTTYGVCGKFVYFPVNNAVRLPKVTGKLDGTTDVTALGDLVAQYIKLPNITGTAGVIAHDKTTSTGYYEYTGALYNNRTVSTTVGFTTNSAWQSDVLGFDASRSSSVYSGTGSDTKIHEQAINVLYYIVVGTTAKTRVVVDMDQIATDLNRKADNDLTNITTSANEKIATASLPSWVVVSTITIGASGATYTASTDGWINLAATVTNQSSGWVQVSVGNCTVRGAIGGGLFTVFLPVRKGQTYTIYYNDIDTWFWAQFTPAQSEA